MMPRVDTMCHAYPEDSSEGAGTTGSGTPVSPTAIGAGRLCSWTVGRHPAGACPTGHRHMGVRFQFPGLGCSALLTVGRHTLRFLLVGVIVVALVLLLVVPPCSRLRNDKSSQRAPDRKRDGDPCRLSLPSLEDQRSSLPFATRITKWASR